VGSNQFGQALVVRHGLVSWMKAWSLAPAVTPRLAGPVSPPLDSPIEYELVSTLARLAIMAAQKGTHEHTDPPENRPASP
jgi:hypothetical protein